FLTASFPQHASLPPSSRNTRWSLPPVNSCPKWSQAGTLMRVTNQRAYRIEKQKIEELHKQKPDQLWNTIDERLIGVTWQEFKRKQREESFQRRQAHRAIGGPAGSQAARFGRSLVRTARAERRLQKR